MWNTIGETEKPGNMKSKPIVLLTGNWQTVAAHAGSTAADVTRGPINPPGAAPGETLRLRGGRPHGFSLMAHHARPGVRRHALPARICELANEGSI